MKFLFKLAIVFKENQNPFELLKKYINNIGNDLEENIKKKRNFITGLCIGEYDDVYNSILITKEYGDYNLKSFAKINEVDWEGILESEILRIEDETLKSVKNMNLDNFFALTDSIITPDGKWHGGIPADLVSLIYFGDNNYKKYCKNYYSEYIKPYKKDGYIMIVTCNI